jgi:hypothetical protein
MNGSYHWQRPCCLWITRWGRRNNRAWFVTETDASLRGTSSGLKKNSSNNRDRVLCEIQLRLRNSWTSSTIHCKHRIPIVNAKVQKKMFCKVLKYWLKKMIQKRHRVTLHVRTFPILFTRDVVAYLVSHTTQTKHKPCLLLTRFVVKH